MDEIKGNTISQRMEIPKDFVNCFEMRKVSGITA